MSKKLKVIYSIYTFLALFAANLPCVEDLVTEGTCNWSCNAESIDIDAKELERKISQGEMVKLKITYEERVDPSCVSANHTLDANDKTEVAEIWVKKMSPSSVGAIQFISKCLLEDVGLTLFKSFKDATVTCILKSATKKHTSQLAFHTPQSVIYFVEQMANYSKRDDKFLTFIRMEKQTHITVNVIGLETNSSQTDAPDHDRKLIVTEIWLFVFVLICGITVLYSHAILLLCRPSEVTVQLIQKKRENSESVRSPVHGDYAENEPLGTPVQEEDNGSEESREGYREYETDSARYGVMESREDEDGTHSEMVGAPQRNLSSISSSFRKTGDKALKAANTVHLETIGHRGDQSGVVCKDYSPTIDLPSTSAGSLTNGEQTQPFENSADPRCSSPRVSSGEVTACDTEPSVAGTAVTDNRDDIAVNITIETPDLGRTRMEERIDSREGNGNCISMIIAGGPYPVSIGSWIGNNLFVATNSNQCHKFKKVVKFIVISFLPVVLLTGFGDLLMLLLKIHPQIALYLPSSGLTSSVFEVMFTSHPGLIVLAASSLLCYGFRCLFVFGIISCHSIPRLLSESSIWKSCFVHSRHLFVVYRLKCLFYPCNECETDSPPECPKEVEVPHNISHNLSELPGIFTKHWDCLCDRFDEYYKTTEIGLCKKVIFFPLIVFILAALITVNLVVDVLLSSPLVCLCHGRMWIFKDRPRFKCVEFVLIVFSLFWVAFYSSSGAVVMETAFVGFVNLFNYHPVKLLQHVGIVALACHYVFSCYRFFTVQYFQLVEELFTCYRKKFGELEKNGEVDKLVSYKQGEHIKLIPRELLKYGCEHKLIKMPVRNSVAILLLKTGVLLLVFLFVFPIIHAPSSEVVLIGTVITVLLIYSYFSDRINGTPKLSKDDVNIVVDDYINYKKQQQETSKTRVA